jgi:hypothetical protein
VVGELRALRAKLPPKVAHIAGGGGDVAREKELAALGITVAPSVPGLIAELRRDQGED